MDGRSDTMLEPSLSISNNSGNSDDKKEDVDFDQDQQHLQFIQQDQDGLIHEAEIDLGQQSDPEVNGSSADAAAAANGSALASAKLSTKKKEALSQVPCKFFRSNGCSAGNACPFAHTMPGEGQGKAVCQWFLKGSCRFGHRCALAHILPGQPMSMDRKNKRAAQQQGGLNGGQIMMPGQQQGINGMVGNSIDGNKRYSAQRSGLISEFGQGDLSRLSNINFIPSEFGPSSKQYGDNSMGANGNGDLMFGMPDDLQVDQMSSAFPNMQSARSTQSNWPIQNFNRIDRENIRSDQDQSAFDGLPMPVGASTTHSGSLTAAQAFGTSPFSHPGSHSVFYSGSMIHDNLGGGRSDKPFGTSMGRAEDDAAALRAAVQRSWEVERDGSGSGAVEDEHAEEFLPSSLSDLLTPVELERRRRSVLASKNASLSKAVNGNTFSSQSMPAHGLESNLKWTLDSRTADSHLSPELDPIVNSTSSMAAKIANRSLLGSSNTTNGFLTSRLQSDLARSRDAWNDSNEDVDQTIKESGQKVGGYSPSVQAVLSHAPGQSLPQGLAAGLSRMHLRSGGIESSLAGSRGLNGDLSGQSTRKRLSGTDLGGSNGGYANMNSASPGVIGGPRSSIDELGPTAPSSIFNHRGTPMHHHFGRSIGANSTSTSFEAGSVSKNTGAHNGSPYLLSPAMRAFDDKGIAIPAKSMEGDLEKNGNVSRIGSGSMEGTNGGGNLTIGGGVSNHQSRMQHLATISTQHPGLHRVRAGGAIGGGIGASPLSLPTTGEEVEEAIFELE